MKVDRTYAWTPHVGANSRSPLPVSVHKEICVSFGMSWHNVKQSDLEHQYSDRFSVVPYYVWLQ